MRFALPAAAFTSDETLPEFLHPQNDGDDAVEVNFRTASSRNAPQPLPSDVEWREDIGGA